MSDSTSAKPDDPGTRGTAAAKARPSVIQLVLRDKAALYAAYIPTLLNGGLFFPTTRPYRLGDEIYLLVAIADDANRHPVVGTVAWITPGKAQGGRPQGVGVHFPGDEKTQALRHRIEEILGASVASTKSTQTL